MIVQPDFPEHWKTRHLVEITGDESAPMAVIRLWAHCQHSRRSFFPDMTPAQLASICRWGDRKPACHTALVKAGFVDKLSPKGFAAHQWSEHNAQLLQKWAAGAKGGRPSKDTEPNENGHSEKPTANRPLTGTKPDQIDQTDQTRSTDQIDQTRPTDGLSSLRAVVGNCSIGDGAGGVVGLAIPDKSVRMLSKPTLEELRNMLKCQFKGAEKWAEAADTVLTKSKMRAADGEPIQNFKKWLTSFASACETNKRLR